MIHRQDPEILAAVPGLRRALAPFGGLPEEEWELLAAQSRARNFSPGEFLAREGSVASQVFYLAKGLVRYYFLTEDGKEFNQHFVAEGGLAGSIFSLFGGQECSFTIEAIEPTRAICLPSSALRGPEGLRSCWHAFWKAAAAYVAALKTEKERELLSESLEERYAGFKRRYPDLVNRLPQYHIASYLGVTPVALSRLRGRLRS